MIRFLFLSLLATFVVSRLARLLRVLGAGRSGRRATQRPVKDASSEPDRLRDLTQQDIDDADYEEIPPEE
jgi:hypothetical protein